MSQYHEDVELFREALTFTESNTGFSGRLIEKDYYCSVILQDWDLPFQLGVMFKGGTCLSKVHTGFYRLSEDLDFVISTQLNVSRPARRKKIEPLKEHFAGLQDRLPCFHLAQPLTGSNLSTQYIGRLTYRSLVTGHEESIKVEIGLREPVVDSPELKTARTILTDPFRRESAIGPIPVNALSLREAYAEKFRAALTRREPAVRDLYDISHAVQAGQLDPTDDKLRELVRQKLTVPGNESVDVSEEKLAALRQQLETQLKPVLRTRDYEQFDLGIAFAVVARLAEQL